MTHAISTLEQLREIIPEARPIAHRKVSDRVDSHARQFIAESPLVFVATTNRDLNTDVSPKGDAPGFVRVESDTSLLIPERPGNGLVYGFQNILQTGSIGLIFVVPGVRETLRINGHATLTRDPALLTQFIVNGKPALLCCRITVKELFFHCGKAMIRSKVWQPESWTAKVSRDASAKQLAGKFSMEESAFKDFAEKDYRNNL